MAETFPTPTDAAYIKRLREDYPERCDGKSDDEVMAYYNPSEFKYVECTLWDHVGDAAYDFERLADAYIALREATRKHLRAAEGKSDG